MVKIQLFVLITILIPSLRIETSPVFPPDRFNLRPQAAAQETYAADTTAKRIIAELHNETLEENLTLRRNIFDLRTSRKKGSYQRELLEKAAAIADAKAITDHLLYKEMRTELMKWKLYAVDETIRREAQETLGIMRENLLEFLGPNETTAVAANFKEGTQEDHRGLISNALIYSPMLKETIYILYGEIVNFSDMERGGIKIYELDRGNNKVVYGVSVTTKNYRNFEFAINIYDPLPWLRRMDDFRFLERLEKKDFLEAVTKFVEVNRANGFLALACPDVHRFLGDAPLDVKDAKGERIGEYRGISTYRLSILVSDKWFELNLGESAFLKGVAGSEVAAIIEAGTMEISGYGIYYPGRMKKTVEDFVGLYEDYSMWAEELVRGKKREELIARLKDESNEEWCDRVRDISPYIIWRSIDAYFDLYNRVDWRWVISDPLPQNVLIPETDYMIDARVIDVGDRAPFENHGKVLIDFCRYFTHEYTTSGTGRLLGAPANWLIFYAFLDSVMNSKAGELTQDGALKYGVALLRKAEEDLAVSLKAKYAAAEAESWDALMDVINSDAAWMYKCLIRDLKSFLEEGLLRYRPRPLAFAKRSYDRWLESYPEASSETKEAMAVYFYQVYGINRLAENYPWWGTIYFAETSFRGSSGNLREALSELAELQRGDYKKAEKSKVFGYLKEKYAPENMDAYYLKQLVIKELTPEERPAQEKRDALSRAARNAKTLGELDARNGKIYQAHISEGAFMSLDGRNISSSGGRRFIVKAKVSDFGSGWRLVILDEDAKPTGAFMEGVFTRQLNRILVTDVNFKVINELGLYAELYRLIYDISPPGLEISSLIVPDRRLYPQSPDDIVRHTLVGEARSEAGFIDHKIIGSSFVSKKPQ